MAVSDTTAGVGERIYPEKISAGTAERSQLKKRLADDFGGDAVIIRAIDRLPRDTF
jgi:DNA invertase Pin-like site-specific DNA recombinase